MTDEMKSNMVDVDAGSQTGGALSQDDRTMGMLCHLLGLIGILGPLIIWLIKKDQSAFVDNQGKEAINFHINLIILWFAAIIVSMIVSFIPFIGWILSSVIYLALVVVGVYALVLLITATMKVNNGEAFKYPYKIDILK